MTRKRNKNISDDLYKSDDESSNGHASSAARSMNNSVVESLRRLDEAGPFPKLVAFDLDYTLWPLWVDTHGVVIAAASRTSAPSAARQALQSLILVDESSSQDGNQQQVKSISFFNQQEIYPGSKLTHFKSLQSKTGIPYEEMLFFDDEHRNAEVGKLGVHFQLVGHSGTDLATFERGVREWRAKAKARQGDLEAGAELIK